MRLEAIGKPDQYKVWLRDDELDEPRRVAGSHRDDLIVQLGGHVEPRRCHGKNSRSFSTVNDPECPRLTHRYLRLYAPGYGVEARLRNCSDCDLDRCLKSVRIPKLGGWGVPAHQSRTARDRARSRWANTVLALRSGDFVEVSLVYMLDVLRNVFLPAVRSLAVAGLVVVLFEHVL